MTKADITSALVKHFSLTDEDCRLRTRSGSLTQLSDRVGWCVQWLRRAEFIEIVSRATYHITLIGLDYLNTHTSLRQSDLMKYPAFAAYASSKNISTHTTSPTSDNPHISELTPTEQLEQAHETISNDLAADLLSKVMEQTPTFFEHLVVDLLVKMGYGGSNSDAARVTQLTNDEGIDGIIYEDKLGLDIIHIQAKRWQIGNNVGRRELQSFVGALAGQSGRKGVFITTSSFTREALEYNPSNVKIAKIDGKRLADLMITYNLGVSTKVLYEIKKLDTDYFDE
jgi:restriction system protein